jgi:RNA polymerase sigma-70 factor, ECF subfamily
MMDEASFRSLYAEHAPRLYLLALRMAGNRSDADDVFQETWVRVAEKPEPLRVATSPRAWLAAILINCSREQRRLAPVAEAQDALQSEPAHGARLDLEAAVHALPDGFRQVLVLHDIEGYKHDEIATLLGIDSGTSRSQLSRARERLRGILEEYRD